MRPPVRILFVDDEPAIRLTLPAILREHGFDVTATESVAGALRAIAAQTFDALISDLNIGEPGDGFTVVSAMRRTQPKCVNFILTGYPAFETALQAIRNQVDDYLVKPAEVGELVSLLETKLRSPKPVHSFQAQSLGVFLKGHADEVLGRALQAMKTDPRLGVLPLSDRERSDHIPVLLEQIVRQLRSKNPNNPTRELCKAGAQHGEVRRRQGYTQEMLVEDTRIIDTCIYAVVQDHLLHIELSNLIPDLSRVNTGLESHLQASLTSYHAKKAA